jgi:hypothetical protein
VHAVWSDITKLDLELYGGRFSRLSGPLASLTGLEELFIGSRLVTSTRLYFGEPLLGKLPLDVNIYKKLKVLRLSGVEVEPATPNPWSDLQGLEELWLLGTTGVPSRPESSY